MDRFSRRRTLPHCNTQAVVAVFVAFWLVAFVSGCNNGGGGGDSSAGTPAPLVTSTVQGFAQKGPFRPGSTVILKRLDSQGQLTGEQVMGQTAGNLGHFNVTASWEGPTLIEIRGNYFDENTGTHSTNPLTLVAVVDLIANTTVESNVTIFTHLVAARLRTLIGQGSTLEDARNTIRSELQTGFGLQLAGGTSPEQLDLTQGAGPSARDNALLLLVSSGLLARSENQRQNTLGLLADDFASNGSGVDVSVIAGALANLDETLAANLSSQLRIPDPPKSADLLSATIPSWIPDQDSDGMPDPVDADRDGDSVPNVSDAFPFDPTETKDTDGDGIGNNADPDDDNDGVADGLDAFPLNPLESVDTDHDGLGNNADPDDDNDGVADSLDAFPLNRLESADTDSDGLGNNADLDDDNDGVTDELDIAPLDPNVGGNPLPSFAELPISPGLPPVLTMMDGTPVTTAADWRNKRAPELRRLFQHYIYGYLPARPPSSFRLLKDNNDAFGGKAIYKEVAIDVRLPDGNPAGTIYLSLYVPKVPKDGVRPARVFLALSTCPNHTVTDYAGVTIRGLAAYGWLPQACYMDTAASGCNSDVERGCRADHYAVENTIDRGYAVAAFYVGDMRPDTAAFSGGIHAPYAPFAPGDSQTKWGALAASAWGTERVVDYLVTDPDIDKTRIAVVGHSRNGKAALLAGAMDTRIGLVIPHQSGTAGTAPSRGALRSVKESTANFPHWYDSLFPAFGGFDANGNPREYRLPLDQHSLIALLAPRSLLDGAGLSDPNYDVDQVLGGLQAANPVYQLLGVPGTAGNGYVNGDTNNIPANYAGRLLQYRRNTAHEMSIDYWNAFIDYADVQFGRAP